MDITPQLLLFYMMAGTIVFSSLLVVFAKNPIHSVLFLILAFLNAAGLFILEGAEFVAMILAIVYVGAVAILFLFVVMMFDVDYRDLKSNKGAYILCSVGMIGLLVVELFAGIFLWKSSDKIQDIASSSLSKLTNTEAIGKILYTDYFLAFQLSGMVLLVAMIGAIVLTLKNKSTMRRQDVDAQISRSPKNTLRLEKVPFRKGIKL